MILLLLFAVLLITNMADLAVFQSILAGETWIKLVCSTRHCRWESRAQLCLDTWCPPYCSSTIAVLATVQWDWILTISLYRWTPPLCYVFWPAEGLIFTSTIRGCWMLCGFGLCWLNHVVLDLVRVFCFMFLRFVLVVLLHTMHNLCLSTLWND